jgi:ribonuclease E
MVDKVKDEEQVEAPKKRASRAKKAPVIAPVFVAPEVVEPAPAKKTAKKAAKKTAKKTTKKAEAKPEPESDEAASADVEPVEGDEDGPRRRRRRGGRGRRKRTDDETAGEESTEESEDGADDDEEAAVRRRRRRRRRGSDSDVEPSPDDPPNTVVKVRTPRAKSGDDQLRGSTRLEAKKQRRREGREAGRRRAPILTEAEFLARREAVDRVMAVRQVDGRTQIAVL